jgi:hypothetical protein
VSPTPSSRSVAFGEVAATSQSGVDAPSFVVGTNDASRAIITRQVPNAVVPPDRVLVAVFQGEQRTGGYAVEITSIERHGDQLVVNATFTEPKLDSMVTQALTSPAHVVSIAAADTKDVKVAVLLDQSGAERARTTIT